MQEPGSDVVLRTRLRRLRERRRGVAVRVAFALALLIALWLATDTPGLNSSLPKPSSAAGPATSPGAWAMAGYDAVQSFAPAGGAPGPERPAWAFPFEGAEAAPPVVAHGVVYLTVRPDRVLALDVDTGAVRWERRLAGPLHGSPAVTEDAVIVAQAPGTVTGLDRNSGRVVWDLEAEGLLFASARRPRGSALRCLGRAQAGRDRSRHVGASLDRGPRPRRLSDAISERGVHMPSPPTWGHWTLSI